MSIKKKNGLFRNHYNVFVRTSKNRFNLGDFEKI